jgi:hypothetical protein
LSPFAKLQDLDLSYNPFTDEGMAGLAGLKDLRRLMLRDTLVTDEGLKYLKDLTQLEEIDLSGARVTDKGDRVPAQPEVDAPAESARRAGDRCVDGHSRGMKTAGSAEPVSYAGDELGAGETGRR